MSPLCDRPSAKSLSPFSVRCLSRISSVTIDGGENDDGSGGNTSGDKLPRMRLMWEVEGGADASTETGDLIPTRVVFSLEEGRIKAGVELEEIASPTRSCVTSDEEPPIEGR